MIFPRILVNDNVISDEIKHTCDASNFKKRIIVKFHYKGFAMSSNQDLELKKPYALKIMSNCIELNIGEYYLTKIKTITEGPVKFKKYYFEN